jgi:HSP20 family protein
MVNLMRRDQNDIVPGARLGRLLGDFFGDGGIPALPRMDDLSFPLDISEDDKNVIVRASLPGFSQEDVDIEVQNGVLTIAAQKEETHEDSGERFLRRERRMGSVVRQIVLPEIVDEEGATADLVDGVLTLRLPKTPEAMPRKIQVRPGEGKAGAQRGGSPQGGQTQGGSRFANSGNAGGGMQGSTGRTGESSTGNRPRSSGGST